jgi:cytochrome c oxidase subunit 2
VQTRYNLPLEIFYTIAPVVMVIVFFVHTVDTQNAVLDDEGEPDHTVYVVGQQWQWTFNYVEEPSVDSPNLWEAGTASYIPTLVLPVGETTEFQLRSPDVIHDLRHPRLPDADGRHPVAARTTYRITPTHRGHVQAGSATSSVAVYHSRMIFNVEVVSPRGLRRLPRGPRGRRQRVRGAAARRHQREPQTGALPEEEVGE